LRSSHILLSHPLGTIQLLAPLTSNKYAQALDHLILDPRANVLMIHGTRDQFTSAKKYEAWSKHRIQIREEAGIITSENISAPVVSSTEQAQSVSSDGSLDKILEEIINDTSGTVSMPPEEREVTTFPVSPDRTHGEHQVNLVQHADHLWQGHYGAELRRIVRGWIERLDTGEFDLPS